MSGSASFGTRLARALGPLDPEVARLQRAVQRWLAAAAPLRELLDGRWLGLPLHPALSDVPVGASTTALLLDLAETVSGRESNARAADQALAVSVLATLPAAASGVSDWRTLQGEDRRLGFAHGLLNAIGLILNSGSLLLRAGGHRGAGKAASALGYAASTGAAHIGGELTFARGIRVNRTAWETTGSEKFKQVMDAKELDGGLHRVEVGNAAVLVTRTAAGRVCAISATCSHLGGPLDEGEREGDTVVCPWHGSRFDLCSGAVLAGPAVFPQPRYETREHAGKVELRRADE